MSGPRIGRRLLAHLPVDVVVPGGDDESACLAGLGCATPVVVDGPLSPFIAARLAALAHAGGRVLLAGHPEPALGGAGAEEHLGGGEWFVTVRPGAAAGRRLRVEFPVTANLTTLQVIAGDSGRDANGEAGGVEVVATTSIRFSHRPVVVRRAVGSGCVVTCGYGDFASLCDEPELSALLARCLAGGAEQEPGAELGVGIIGYGPLGGMGYTHGQALNATDGLRFVAVCDAVPERVLAAGVDFPGIHASADAAGMAADPDVAVVVVATPPVRHAGLALQLLRAGKHVVLEKPMCLTKADADRIIAVASAAAITVTVHQNRRWDPDWATLRHAVSAGSVGEVFNVETFVGGFEHPCRAWHSEESVSGGAVYDWGAHHIDWILQLYGSTPQTVSTVAHKRVWRDVTNHDQLAVRMRWPDGREATFHQSDVAAIRRPKFYVQGTGGTIAGHYRPLRFERLDAGRGYVEHRPHHAEAPVDLQLVRYEPRRGLVHTTLEPLAPPAPSFWANLADHLLLGEPLAVPPEDSRRVVATLEAAHLSALNAGREVVLDTEPQTDTDTGPGPETTLDAGAGQAR